MKYWKDWLKIGILITVTIVSVFCAVKFRTVIVVGSSMSPALRNGDRCLMYKTQNIERYDVICFKYSNGDSYAKRVIGLPGERIFVCETGIAICSKTDKSVQVLEEKYLVFRNNGFTGLIDVGKDEVYVLGDNRPNSHDSRIFGPVKINKIEGVLEFILWNRP